MSRKNTTKENIATTISVFVGGAALLYGCILLVAIVELAAAVRFSEVDPLRLKAALQGFVQTICFLGWCFTILHLIRRHMLQR